MSEMSPALQREEPLTFFLAETSFMLEMEMGVKGILLYFGLSQKYMINAL